MEALRSVGSPKVDFSGRETVPNWMTIIAIRPHPGTALRFVSVDVPG